MLLIDHEIKPVVCEVRGDCGSWLLWCRCTFTETGLNGPVEVRIVLVLGWNGGLGLVLDGWGLDVSVVRSSLPDDKVGWLLCSQGLITSCIRSTT